MIARLWCKWFHRGEDKIVALTVFGAPYRLCLKCRRAYSYGGTYITRIPHGQNIIQKRA